MFSSGEKGNNRARGREVAVQKGTQSSPGAHRRGQGKPGGTVGKTRWAGVGFRAGKVISGGDEAEVRSCSPERHRREKAVIPRGQTKVAARWATPKRQPDQRGYRQFPKPWGWVPLLGIRGGIVSADKILGPAPGSPGPSAKVGEAQDNPHLWGGRGAV